jgi:hypothetical protein
MPFEQLSKELDKLFFLPLVGCETAELRAVAIEQFLMLNGWNWDQVLEELYKPRGN